MSTRYTKQHYEDVARILKEQSTHWSGIVNDGQAIVAGLVLAHAIESFADLFAADNPPMCSIHGIIGNERKNDCPIDSGFNRAQFLAACGLEPVRHE